MAYPGDHLSVGKDQIYALREELQASGRSILGEDFHLLFISRHYTVRVFREELLRALREVK